MIKTAIILLLYMCCSVAMAEDNFDDDLDFEIRKKSTIRDFPLQEMDAETLSDAVIEGALQATSAGSGSGKPAYLAQEEVNEKQSKEELDLEDDPAAVSEALRFGPTIAPEIPYQQPVFQMDTGRTGQYNNTSFERP